VFPTMRFLLAFHVFQGSLNHTRPEGTTGSSQAKALRALPIQVSEYRGH
jgi:hypothetical protein